ncbi:MAG: BamA/TamA family outer membrane protein [bacterium]|nr:BamA/TamA family outer membrane protein [bacterium]
MLCLIILLLATPPEFIVKSIKFDGLRSIPSKKLRAVMHTSIGKPYDEFQAKMDEKRLINFYKSKGFKQIKIKKFETNINIKKKQINCKIYLDEGKGTTIKDIIFEGNKNFTTEQLKNLSKLRANTLMNEEAVILAKYTLADFYSKKGYAYAEINDSLIPSDSFNVIVCFNIKEYNIARFGDLTFQGKRKTRRQIIERELTFKKGDLYSPNKLYESQAKIYGTELFESVKFDLPALEEAHQTGKTPDTLNVVFILEEKKRRWVSSGGGLYNDPSIRTWFELGWGHMNLWGNGQKLETKFNYEINPINLNELQRGRLDILYSEPYFINSSFKAQAAPYYEFDVNREDSTSNYYIGIQGRLGKYIGRFLQSFIIYNYEIIHEEGTIIEDKNLANSLTLSLSWDSRSDVFYPRHGVLSAVSYEYAGEFLGGDFSFQKFLVDFTYYAPFHATTVVSRIKFGGITGVSPEESKFLLGGTDGIRGYQNIIDTKYGENWLGLLDLEYRIPTIKNFEIAYFMDIGNVWQESKNVSITNIKFGLGIGLRYRTPIGPIRIDYGRKLLDSENDKGKLYFNIGYMF